MHFIRREVKLENARMVVLVGGIDVEQLKIIEPLTDRPRTAERPRTRSTSSSRRCRAAAFPGSRHPAQGLRSR
jgi:hypothetical protein